MGLFSSQLSIYKLVFLFELLVGEFIFSFKFKRKRHFVLKTISLIILIYVLSIFLPIPVYNWAYTSFMFLYMFLLSLLGMKLCFKEPTKNIVFSGVLAYSAQNFAHQLFNFLVLSLGLMQNGILDSYNNGSGSVTWDYKMYLVIIIYISVYLIVYWALFTIFYKTISKVEVIEVERTSLLIITSAVLAMIVVINSIVTYSSMKDFKKNVLLIVEALMMISLVISLTLQFQTLSQGDVKNKLEQTEYLLNQSKKQYDSTKANIDIINQKCHDLKYQISLITRDSNLRDESIKKIDNSIKIYESSVRTGNQSLDVVLTDKSLVCSANKINLTCVVDGKSLSFINNIDLFTLVGNALDNAIEAVKKLPEKERFIVISAYKKRNFVIFMMRNSMQGNLKFVDGLPETTKKDKNYHGFGMLSIKNIVDKYHGSMDIKAEDGVFSMTVLFDEVNPSGSNQLR